MVLKSYITYYPQRIDLLDNIDEGGGTSCITALESSFFEICDRLAPDFVIECSLVDAKLDDTPQVPPRRKVDGLLGPPQ